MQPPPPPPPYAYSAAPSQQPQQQSQQQQQQQQQQQTYQKQQSSASFSSEPYGAVKAPIYQASPPLVQRRVAAPAPYVLSASSLGGDSSAPSAAAATLSEPLHSTKRTKTYQHNTAVAVFLGIPLFFLLWNHVSPAPLQAFLYCSLVIYALDLANSKDVCMVGIWIAFAVLAATNAWTLLMGTDDHEASGGGTMLVIIFEIMVETLLCMCLACWTTLQFTWLQPETPLMAKMMEQILHASLVPISASVFTYQCMSTAIDYVGTDRVVTVAPHLFAVTLVAAMLFIGSCETSFGKKVQVNDQHQDFIIPSMTARIHSCLLLLIPPLMHIISFRKRIASSYASFDEWYDLILVWTVPYLLHFGIHLLHLRGGDNKHKSPYSMPMSILFPQSGSTLRGALIPMLVSVLASFALQQAYLIPFCQSISYQFNGHDLPNIWITSAFLSASTLTALGAFWVYGKKSVETNEPLFGEYHDDVVQLSLALSGLCVGKAVGMPWNLTPLPILAFLGFTIWVTTRMLRYLAILLFVLHSAGVVIFSYRFAGISNVVDLAVPGVKVHLIRLGMLVIFTSVLVALVMGMAVRSKGGVGSEIMKRFDFAGLVLILYSFMLAVLEFTFLKEEVPFHNLFGIEVHDETEDMQSMLYNPRMALVTGAVVVGISMYLQKCKVISPKTGIVAISSGIGKGIAVIIDMHQVQARGKSEDTKADAVALLARFLVATLMLVILMAPRAFLEPVHVKTSGSARFKKHLGPNGKPVSDAPPNANRTIMIYAMLVLPLTLVASIRFVLYPLMGVLSGHWNGAYYAQSPAASEIIGLASSLWGLSVLSMVNHYLPDGGGETWKKVSALTFLMGLGVAISAPTLPNWTRVARKARKASNPFAALSSIGSQLINNNRSRSGGWGLIFASLATLLAITGPLELQERRLPGGRKDKLLLLRMMVFSIMFGCGVSWFITLQSMSEEAFLPLFVTSVACMAMSFFGTVAGVLGHFLELENFEEVEQVVKVWIGAFPIFGLTAATAQLVRNTAHPFGIGGWLSTYLSVCSIVAVAFAVVLRTRRTKDAGTRALGNLCCTFAWLCAIAVLYGRYGVAGLDAGFDVTTIFGLPASVFGTFLASLFLLALEGEGSSSRSSSKPRRNSTTGKARPRFGLSLPKLHRANQFAPALASIVVVFVTATLYVIFIRGSSFFSVATSYSQVFSAIFGSGKGTTPTDDLAKLAEKNMIHSQALMTSAKLAGSGFWTCSNPLGPLLHLGGLAATLPSLYFLVLQAWSGRGAHAAVVTLTTPLNLIPILLCKGIPTLTAAAFVGLIGGVLQLFVLRSSSRQSKMRI